MVRFLRVIVWQDSHDLQDYLACFNEVKAKIWKKASSEYVR